ncbi:hypothetical protein HF313_15020 [Massilia atriviolacea]|uniref:Uncharacterized protein n=1 Tax=Massilia atriviolacea TaxID=2495579 RepID=A0A430HR79_9BURK|nr:hypothetical protein [Massilia atriviolacea]RSZ60024.1 hypothetical protein EJB06_07545 [Massilia atriviolacea]
MGAFCVYGISRSVCKITATKKQPTTGKGTSKSLTISEFGAARDELAERLFAETTKRGKISPELDAPQFCMDWIAAGKDEVKDCVIMSRGPKVDKNGGPVIKQGAPVMTWVEYDPKSAPAFGPMS